MMQNNLIIVANEFQMVRESLGLAIAELRPCLEILILDPSELTRVANKRPPTLVICSLPESIQAAPSANWLLIPPEGRDLAVVCFAGNELQVIHANLETIIQTIDEAVRIGKMT